MAGPRFVFVLGIIGLLAAMAGVTLYGIADLLKPMPSSCVDFNGPSALAPAGCTKGHLIIYIVALMALGSGGASSGASSDNRQSCRSTS